MPNAIKLRKILLALHRLGFTQVRRKGSHAFFEHQDGRTTLIPFHKEIKVKLLTKIAKHDVKMDLKEFLRLAE